GACTWVCPAEIPLVHLFRTAKATIRRQKAIQQAADKAKEPK
ncbi:MAG: hypothetical protein GXP62_11920, partial [Oligoflexia bacterium]|nr:hypothetical protein [Oligoflexia bacterium]